MPSDKTFVTELATGLGMVGGSDLDDVLEKRPSAFANLGEAEWERLLELRRGGTYSPEFLGSFLNGRAFLASPFALRNRPPRLIEWTGGRRPPGDEVAPADLRIDYVYLVSCKYLSKILHNPSPARLVDGLLSHDPIDDQGDWFHRSAEAEYQSLYASCRFGLGLFALPVLAGDLTPSERRVLAQRLAGGWPAGAADAYEALCEVVASSSAKRWRSHITARNASVVLWRLLRIGSTPYFVVGTSGSGPTRLRIDTPWDWRQRYVLRDLEVAPEAGGQARVAWSAWYHDRVTGEDASVSGHVEIRWSHGRFAQPPEAKVYLDSPIDKVPGYHEI